MFFSIFFFERTRPAASMKPPCLSYVFTSNEGERWFSGSFRIESSVQVYFFSSDVGRTGFRSSWVKLGLRSSPGIVCGSHLRGLSGSSGRVLASSEKVVLEAGVVYALSGASALCLSTRGSIYQDQRTAAFFFQQFRVERTR